MVYYEEDILKKLPLVMLPSTKHPQEWGKPQPKLLQKDTSSTKSFYGLEDAIREKEEFGRGLYKYVKLNVYKFGQKRSVFAWT